eukprot:comp21219_c0_seq1/m.28859 comp21219_c0_seq1/g.28859  ORF comp21219_c0_seq1/g.28859 comp21219_c0_seq1/m.28859 type:complete len:340 (+) comp21219_c0_seq1:210-1229(+)
MCYSSLYISLAFRSWVHSAISTQSKPLDGIIAPAPNNSPHVREVRVITSRVEVQVGNHIVGTVGLRENVVIRVCFVDPSLGCRVTAVGRRGLDKFLYLFSVATPRLASINIGDARKLQASLTAHIPGITACFDLGRGHRVGDTVDFDLTLGGILGCSSTESIVDRHSRETNRASKQASFCTAIGIKVVRVRVGLAEHSGGGSSNGCPAVGVVIPRINARPTAICVSYGSNIAEMECRHGCIPVVVCTQGLSLQHGGAFGLGILANGLICACLGLGEVDVDFDHRECGFEASRSTRVGVGADVADGVGRCGGHGGLGNPCTDCKHGGTLRHDGLHSQLEM